MTSDRAPSRRLPLTVIGGFLGAGKTTLLNRWLRDAGGQRLAVLVNDFGAINIDAALIQARTGRTIALSNGCVCCQIGGDLSRALIEVLESAQDFDAVVIEASGVSDPWRIAQLGRADPGLELDGVIVVVDASEVQAQWRDPLLTDTLERQLKAADLIVVNHCDRVTLDARARVSDWIALVAGATPQFETTHARVPLQILSGLALIDAHDAPEPAFAGGDTHDSVEGTHGHGESHQHTHQHPESDPAHGALFDTWSGQPARVFASTALRAWLNAPPPGLLRLKGVLRTGADGTDGAWSELQFAGRHGALRKAHVPATGAALVAIGLRGRLPCADLTAMFGDRPRSPTTG